MWLLFHKRYTGSVYSSPLSFLLLHCDVLVNRSRNKWKHLSGFNVLQLLLAYPGSARIPIYLISHILTCHSRKVFYSYFSTGNLYFSFDTLSAFCWHLVTFGTLWMQQACYSMIPWLNRKKTGLLYTGYLLLQEKPFALFSLSQSGQRALEPVRRQLFAHRR